MNSNDSASPILLFIRKVLPPCLGIEIFIHQMIILMWVSITKAELFPDRARLAIGVAPMLTEIGVSSRKELLVTRRVRVELIDSWWSHYLVFTRELHIDERYWSVGWLIKSGRHIVDLVVDIPDTKAVWVPPYSLPAGVPTMKRNIVEHDSGGPITRILSKTFAEKLNEGGRVGRVAVRWYIEHTIVPEGGKVLERQGPIHDRSKLVDIRPAAKRVRSRFRVISEVVFIGGIGRWCQAHILIRCCFVLFLEDRV